MRSFLATRFDTWGHGDVFSHPHPGSATTAAALRALCCVVEPTVVEAATEGGVLFHLVAGEPKGRTYVIVPERTVSVPRLHEAQLVAWFEHLPQPPYEVLISEGWFLVDADPGDQIMLRQGRGADPIEVCDHHGESAVLGPTTLLVVAPLVITLKPQTGWLQVAVQWSAWTDEDGVGRARFQRMRAELAGAGWVRENL